MFYHATKKENVFSIIKNGLKAGVSGYVYLSDTVDGALEFMTIRGEGGEYAVIPVYLDRNEVEEGIDHNKKYIKANSFVYDGDIPRDRIATELHDIPLFVLK